VLETLQNSAELFLATDNLDFVCRYFAPWIGINEDPGELCPSIHYDTPFYKSLNKKK
jgi:hypothetical protein